MVIRVIIVAQRPETIAGAQRVVRLQQGKVPEVARANVAMSTSEPVAVRA